LARPQPYLGELDFGLDVLRQADVGRERERLVKAPDGWPARPVHAGKETGRAGKTTEGGVREAKETRRIDQLRRAQKKTVGLNVETGAILVRRGIAYPARSERTTG
jgi:hypothetical protein